MPAKTAAQVPSLEDYEKLRLLVSHHIDSYDHMLEYGIEKIMMNIKPIEVFDSVSNQNLRIWFEKPEVLPPEKEHLVWTRPKALYPFECRQAKISYTGKFLADVCFKNGDGPVIREKFNFGQLPIMLKSKLCYLRDADPTKLVSCKEESSEMGGYFIVNGLEKVIRLLIMPKRNYPTSMIRKSFQDRQEGYTDKAVVIRCVREDQSAVTLKLYYLSNGSARVGFWVRGREFMLPVGLVLKALIDTSDHEIYTSLTCVYNAKYEKQKGSVGTQILAERAKIILNEVRDLALFTRSQCLQHIGEHFHSMMVGLEDETSAAVGDAVLRDFILVHLDNNYDKFNLLIFMLQKLFSLVDQTSLPDNPDALQNQEVLTPGHLITIYLKEKLQEWLQKVKRLIQDAVDDRSKDFDFTFYNVKKAMDKHPAKQIGLAIENLVKTGNLGTQSGLDLQQRSGFTVMAERLNFLRFLSHFRAVHRGASFQSLRTTSVRKLLPESWGFICPVHTPDGEPCGLLNHMTVSCLITSYYGLDGSVRDFSKMKKAIIDVLVGVGMAPSSPKLVQAGPPEVLSVVLDGCVVGTIPTGKVAEEAVSYLRGLKRSKTSKIPHDMEVGYIPLSMGGAYPGLYLFTSPSRFARPVRSLLTGDYELIGPFEQVYMEIHCPDGGERGAAVTYIEIHPNEILSVIANLTPFSPHNQSPRLVYQCQMAKQTMGSFGQAINCRADQKLYHLQTPQSPIVRTDAYDKYRIDEYPLGTNAIVAILAYTGYDMEDAMVLNKSSVERGFCHGFIYQTETIDLTEERKSDFTQKSFRRSNLDKSSHSYIDSDGLPYVGQTIKPGEPYCTIYNEVTSTSSNLKLKGSEPVAVDYVAVDGKNKNKLKKVNIRFRLPRNPTIGDKFSSRHGQKGVCSQLYPDIDMPFSGVTGMRPDLIINPHAFPSRMTIAMLLETIAAKGGCLHGKFVDGTTFADIMEKEIDPDTENVPLIDKLGSVLAKRGYNYHGNEVLYCGNYGTELMCKIFIGPVYYQRLRHMVSDKYQARSTGAVDQVTRQPIKGRKKGGGIRFGEMERDALLAHGAAFLLHDRLHTCSDYHIADVCTICGSILTTSLVHQQEKTAMREISGLSPYSRRMPKKETCVFCKTSKGMEKVALPYVFRYLAAELAATNIRMTLDLSNERSLVGYHTEDMSKKNHASKKRRIESVRI